MYLLACALIVAIDGDTVRCDGNSLRPLGPGQPNVLGFDTPEIGRNADCAEEERLGQIAKARMADLLQTPGLSVEASGIQDHFGRELVWLRLPTGQTIGEVLIAEGHAVEWFPGYRDSWCERT